MTSGDVRRSPAIVREMCRGVEVRTTVLRCGERIRFIPDVGIEIIHVIILIPNKKLQAHSNLRY